MPVGTRTTAVVLGTRVVDGHTGLTLRVTELVRRCSGPRPPRDDRRRHAGAHPRSRTAGGSHHQFVSAGQEDSVAAHASPPTFSSSCRRLRVRPSRAGTPSAPIGSHLTRGGRSAYGTRRRTS